MVSHVDKIYFRSVNAVIIKLLITSVCDLRVWLPDADAKHKPAKYLRAAKQTKCDVDNFNPSTPVPGQICIPSRAYRKV